MHLAGELRIEHIGRDRVAGMIEFGLDLRELPVDIDCLFPVWWEGSSITYC